eukprot:g1451.t1
MAATFLLLLLIIITAANRPAAAAAAPTAAPHILVVLSDDLGWANVGWHAQSNETITPNLDALRRDGLELDNFRAFKYCSPSRSALQTGRSPIHVNVVNPATNLNNGDDAVSGWSGIPTNMTGIAEKLVSAGYRAHAVGKWDVGMATERHTPLGRGYETWLGYFGHCNDYWTEVDKCGMQKCGDVDMVDLWSQNVSWTNPSRPASSLNNSQTCSQSEQDGCTFEDDLFLERAKRIVREHDTTSPAAAPLFLFWGIHACHGPREVPRATYDAFAFVDYEARKKYVALANYMDQMVGELVDELKAKGIYDNTLIVFASDNGGDDQANNYPLRGAKFSNWEGGIRVPALVSGGALPEAQRGATLGGLTALWDLYATLGEAAGLSAEEATADAVAEAAGLPGVDSISHWGYWTGAERSPPRTELAIGAALGNDHGAGNGYLPTTVEGIISSDVTAGTQWKLLLSDERIAEAIWTGPLFPNSTSKASDWDASVDCSAPGGGCLFNLTADPEERHDLSERFPGVVANLSARIAEINATVFSPHRGAPDEAACGVALSQNGGFWGPFAS